MPRGDTARKRPSCPLLKIPLKMAIIILLLVGLILAGWGLKVLHPMLWTFVVLSGLTVAQRIRRTWQQLTDDSQLPT